MVDKRKQGIASNFFNDAMVNALYVYRDGITVMTGDALGALKTWDIRSGRCIQVYMNEPTKKPISHIAMYHGPSSSDEPRYMAVNSYDNILRVYDRGLDPVQTPLRLIHVLKGHRTKNWPIKCAFFQGRQSPIPVNRQSERLPDIEDVLFDGSRSAQIESILLATGSADCQVYSYAMTTAPSVASPIPSTQPSQPEPAGITSPPLAPQTQQPHGSWDIAQRLNGHTDRVYAVDFHPTDTVVASCSADFGVKIWAMRRRDVGAPI